MGLAYPPVRERQEALEETLTILDGLWGTSPFSFAGKHHVVRDARIPAPVQRPAPPLLIAGSGDRTLAQVARHADMANFGPGPAGRVDTPEQARVRLEALWRQCETIDRDPDSILCSLFTHWLVMAPDEDAVAAKIRRYFPDGLDAFWGAYLVSGTPERVAAYYRPYVDIGIRFLDLQVLDPGDEETMSLIIDALGPQLGA
jgi:alkanesulfonate monooxygenase SsuD/methylene tetrahydromethanopterin reductase-like flavin-dependent oxidoreductase (luciferase family)